ncbi:MAG: hypothetical protein IKE78_08870 [Erysipelotrichaceae bacterium]|nr:hypothetical protein [Erysipelotrichaceae bacterium]
MPYFSEMQNARITDKNNSFDEKKSLLKYDDNNMLYQLLKYLYNNHRDTTEDKDSANCFHVTTKVRKSGRRKNDETSDTRRYVFPSPEYSEGRGKKEVYRDLAYFLDSELREIPEYNRGMQDLNEADKTKKRIEKLRDDLENALREIAEYNINMQVVSDMVDFEKLESIKQKTGPKGNSREKRKSRTARFNKSIISPGIKIKLDKNDKGPSRMKALLYAYALKMSAEEAQALLKAVDNNSSINIWNGYELIVFYAIGRREKDITLNDLNALGQIMTEEKNIIKIDSRNVVTDTSRVWNSLDDLLEMDKEESLFRMRKLLRNIRKVNKNDSIRRKEDLDSMFEFVARESRRIFKGDYAEKCHPGKATDRNTLIKCRNAITDQFFPYYENQIQFYSREDDELYISLQQMRSLPTKKHLNAVDSEKQQVTMADLEFAFFLKFVLEKSLTDYGNSDVPPSLEDLIDMRFRDYRLKVDAYMNELHFLKTDAMDPFERMLMLCMQKEYPIKELHSICSYYFVMKDETEVHDI